MKIKAYLFTIVCCTLALTACATFGPDIYEDEGAAFNEGGPVIPGEFERGAYEQAELFDVPETYGPGLYDFPQLFPEPYIEDNPEVYPEEGLDFRF